MERLKQWLTKKPATKATWVAALTGIMTLIVVSSQTFIYYRQAQLMEQQAIIAAEQTKLTQNQIQLSTRPFIKIGVVFDSGEARNEVTRLRIQNHGAFSVQNLRVRTLYFVNLVDQGWWCSASGGGLSRKFLSPKETWVPEMGGLGKYFHETISKNHSIKGGLEFVVFLVSFEREIDGKAYLDIEPTLVTNNELWPEGDSLDETSLTGMSGTLDKVGSPAIELVFEYFRRHPLPRTYELYNYNYLLGYTPTGILGNIRR